jgi:hypothetical protein
LERQAEESAVRRDGNPWWTPLFNKPQNNDRTISINDNFSMAFKGAFLVLNLSKIRGIA